MLWDAMPDSIKSRYKWENGILYSNKKELSNYYVKPLKFLNAPSGNGSFLLVRYFVGETETTFDKVLKIKDGKKIDIPDVLELITFRKTAVNEIETMIKLQLPSEDDSEWYIDSIGWNKVGNKWLYCFGDKILPDDFTEKIHIDSWGLKTFSVDESSLPSDSKAIKLIEELIQFNNVPVNICLHYLVISLLRSLFLDANVPPQFVLYIHGKTESYKTTIAKYFFDIYGQEKGNSFAMEDLTSSSAALHVVLSRFKDCAFILDDLSDGLSKSETQRKKNLVNDFIRTASNVERRLTKTGNDVKGDTLECSLVVTAEYTLNVESLVNRCISIDMNKYALSQDILQFLYKNPRLSTAFSKMFLLWACQNTDFILKRIINNWDFQRNCGRRFSNEQRLHDSACVLLIASSILQDFLNAKGCNVKIYQSMLMDSIDSVVIDVESIIREIQSNKAGFDIAKEIVKLINENKIAITPYIFGGDAYVKKDMLCINPSYLMNLLNDVAHHKPLTVIAISKYLKHKNLLKLDKSGDATLKGTNNKRYYYIYLQRLCDEANMDISLPKKD